MFFDIKLLPVFLAVLPALVKGQQVGTIVAEVHPTLQWHKCQKGGHCTDVHGSVVLDAEFRWLHDSHGHNCYQGDSWNGAACPDPKTCAQNCALEGAQYQSTYGIESHGNSLSLKLVTQSQSSRSVGSRLYLLADEHNYEVFKLLGQEFTFDVDISKLPCGLNGALYFVAMEKDGGSKHPTNKAGAKYGTGYCDSQCPHGLHFVNGEANSGSVKHGACCPEMDIWEANSMAAVLTAHPCTVKGMHMCTGDACGITCDGNGCDFNSYRQGDRHFYGPGMKVDTTKKFTVVTQFITNDGTPHGHLTDIRRFYVQNGHVIANSMSTVAGIHGNSLNQAFCDSQISVFKGPDSFNKHGGLKKLSDELHDGMVLSFSLWDDHGSDMLWLDSNWPKDADPKFPGVARGPCPVKSGTADQLEKQFPNSAIIFSNMKVGPINSTFHH